ncbi:hypothetical protein GQ53DRAFT_747187 [Thozetella sp. PMI_491]|nr:hypothetical protein GQ53DRAFT_747187 [Thozetella sp. PMI_491]
MPRLRCSWPRPEAPSRGLDLLYPEGSGLGMRRERERERDEQVNCATLRRRPMSEQSLDRFLRTNGISIGLCILHCVRVCFGPLVDPEQDACSTAAAARLTTLSPACGTVRGTVDRGQRHSDPKPDPPSPLIPAASPSPCLSRFSRLRICQIYPSPLTYDVGRDRC